MRQTAIGILLCSWLTSSNAQPPSSHDDLERARCANVKVLESAQVDGRTLIEIPDVTAPQLRLANMLVSSACYERAESLITQYLRTDGVDPQAAYVMARFIWTTRGQRAAEEFLGEQLHSYPSFASLQVLLAGIRIEQDRLPEASKILDGLAAAAPTDLWVYLDRLRIKAAIAPNPELVRTLLEVLSNSRLPPNVRRTAGDTLKHMDGVSEDDLETIFKELVAAEQISEGCTATEYATWLIELENRVDDARAVLERYIAGHMRCPSRAHGRVLLAYTYLIAAAQIAPTPTAANAAWLQRTDELLDGDYSALAAWLRDVPRGVKLRPLVADRFPPDTTDLDGRTPLCRAVMTLNLDLVRTELERGADPDQDCDGNALTWVLLTMRTHEHVDARRGILRLLLEHDARPYDEPGCHAFFSEDCAVVFGPTLAEFGK
jgi:hypothetical protein